MENLINNPITLDNETKHMKRFIIKYTVLSSIITWIFSDRARCTITKFFDTFIDPLFSVDLNNDGKPDLGKLKSFTFYIGSRLTQKNIEETFENLITEYVGRLSAGIGVNYAKTSLDFGFQNLKSSGYVLAFTLKQRSD